MLRLLSFLTLLMVAICLMVGASIALADERAMPHPPHVIEAIDPDRRMIDDSLAAAEDIRRPEFARHA